MLSLSSRGSVARPSPTLSITAKANLMRKEGHDVISFGAGEPDFNTPEPVCAAATRALESEFTKYTPTSGIPELKDAIAAKLKRQNGITAGPENIVVSCGAKHSLFNAIMMLVEPGDEVILLAPYWMTYYDQVMLAGGTPVEVMAKEEDGFVPQLEAIKEAITGKTKAIIVNSPSNPTGAVYSRNTLKGIAALALRHGLWVICDEIYERLVYGAEHFSLAGLGSEIAEQTVTVGGCSKSFAMTGWRIGYACAPVAVSKAMSTFQDQVTSNPTSFAQKGAVAAYQMDDAEVEKMRKVFEDRCALMGTELRKIQGVGVTEPSGAFYYFINVKAFLNGRVRSDSDLSDCLLEDVKVATVPGSVFGAPGYLRLSYSCKKEHILEGVSRISRALSTLI